MTDTQLTNIQKYFLESSPYGELTKTIKHLEKLCSLNLQDPQIQGTIQSYCEQHLVLMTIPDSHQNYPLMKTARTQNCKYVDQINNKIYTVDHIKGKITSVVDNDSDLPQSVRQLLEALNKKLSAYLKKYYKDPAGNSIIMSIDEESGLTVHLGFTSKNLNKCLTGEWTSVWQINKEKIKANVSIHAHYFEQGNVQFHQNKQLNQEFKFVGDMDINAENIIKIIQQFESKIQASINQVYDQMPNNFFKHLRRVAPITKTKMIWNINTIKMNQNLNMIKKDNQNQ